MQRSRIEMHLHTANCIGKSIGFKLKPDIAAEQVLLRVFGDQPVLLE